MCSQPIGNPEAGYGCFDEDHKRTLEQKNSSLSGLAMINQTNLLVTSTVCNVPLSEDVGSYSSRSSVAENLQVVRGSLAY